MDWNSVVYNSYMQNRPYQVNIIRCRYVGGGGVVKSSSQKELISNF